MPTREDITAAALQVDPDLTEDQLDHVTGRVDAIYWWSDIVRTVRHHMADGHACDPADTYQCPGAHVLDAIGRGVHTQINAEMETTS